MNFVNLFQALLISFVFTLWPIVAKWSGVPPSMSAVVVYATGLIASLAFYLYGNRGLPIEYNFRFLCLAGAGLLNGAFIILYIMITSDKNVQAGTFMITVALFGCALPLLLDWAFNDARISINHVAGMLLAAGAVYLLNKK